MTPVEVDYSRSRLLVDNKPLAQIVCGAPIDYVFDGRTRCPPDAHCSIREPCLYHKLEREQLRFHELRLQFLMTRSVAKMRALAHELPRLQRLLERAATGIRYSNGAVRRFDDYMTEAELGTRTSAPAPDDKEEEEAV